MHNREWMPLDGATDHLQAEAIRQTLQAAGIECHIQGEEQACGMGEVSLDEGGRSVRILVPAMEWERARQLIDAGRGPRYA